MLVRLHCSFDSVALRLKDVTIQGETMAFDFVGWQRSSKPINRDFFVSIVILQDISDSSEGVEILVLI